MINTFECLGMQDPFSHEVATKQETGEKTPTNTHDTAGNGKSCTLPKNPDDYVYA